MGKKPTKIIEKKSFNLDSFKEQEGLDNVIKEKEITWRSSH